MFFRGKLRYRVEVTVPINQLELIQDHYNAFLEELRLTLDKQLKPEVLRQLFNEKEPCNGILQASKVILDPLWAEFQETPDTRDLPNEQVALGFTINLPYQIRCLANTHPAETALRLFITEKLPYYLADILNDLAWEVTYDEIVYDTDYLYYPN